MQNAELIFQRRGAGRVTPGTSHKISYPPVQVLQLVAVHVAQPELLVEDWASDVLLFDGIAKADIRRSVLGSLHFGQETESISRLEKHRSSNLVPHCIHRNSYIGIRNHLWRFPTERKAQTQKSPRLRSPAKKLYGAGNGARTRDIQLGKLTLYQLSYARIQINVYIIQITVKRVKRFSSRE